MAFFLMNYPCSELLPAICRQSHRIVILTDDVEYT